jgi:YVTN family beta-propeller protein
MKRKTLLMVSLIMIALWVCLPAFAAGSKILVAGDKALHIIDLSSFKVLKTLPLGSPATGVCVLPEGTTAYISHNNGLVSVFDMNKEKFVRKLKVGNSCADVVCSYTGKDILVTDINARNKVAFVDTTNEVSKGVAVVGANPRKAAFSLDDSYAFVNNSGSRSVSVLDMTKRAVLGNIPLGSNPIDIAICPDNSIAVIPCFGSNNAYIIKIRGLKALGMIEGLSKPSGVTFDPMGKYIYISNYGRKSIQIFKAQNFKAMQEIFLSQSPSQLLMSNDGNKLFVVMERGKLLSLNVDKFKVHGLLELKDKINALTLVK